MEAKEIDFYDDTMEVMTSYKSLRYLKIQLLKKKKREWDSWNYYNYALKDRRWKDYSLRIRELNKNRS